MVASSQAMLVASHAMLATYFLLATSLAVLVSFKNNNAARYSCDAPYHPGNTTSLIMLATYFSSTYYQLSCNAITLWKAQCY